MNRWYRRCLLSSSSSSSAGMFLFVWLWQQVFHFHFSEAQQVYLNNKQLNCNYFNTINFTKGYDCNGVSSSCPSYLTFRSIPPYNTPPNIAFLLSSDTSLISTANNIPDVNLIPTGTLLIIPINNCSCSSSYYQHNSSYQLRSHSENYFSVSNDTYQGLTTCQAMMAQNPYGYLNLSVDLILQVPLRCACPTPKQAASGIKFLLTYMVTWKDDISSIAKLFQVNQEDVLDANELSPNSIIYPFTPILVPLASVPVKIQPLASPPPTPPLPIVPPAGNSNGNNNNSSKRWPFVGVGIGVGLLLLITLSAFLFCFFPRKKKGQLPISVPVKIRESGDYGLKSDSKSKSKPCTVSSEGMRHAIDSLTIYRLEELQKATEFFGHENRIKGSVYRGTFKGDDAAVKVMKGDVSKEINILKTISHTNIVRLSGFCVHGSNTYLVYEFADNGSLSDWLHKNNSNKQQTAITTLTWKQRVQIAYDVADALNYLHNYTNPPYVHKNLNTSNILLDASFRAKISNFGLARSTVLDSHQEEEEEEEEEEGQGEFQLTRHVVGTQGYMAPEYIENGVISPKLDVFAFGIVTLELLSGMEAVNEDGKNRGEYLLSASIKGVLEGDNVREKLKNFIDPSLTHKYPLDLAFSLAQLANKCVSNDLNSRPPISEVFMTVSKILSSSIDWDPSDVEASSLHSTSLEY